MLDESESPIRVEALDDARILVGSAAKHPHPLVLGSHSIYMSREALARGEARIRAVYGELQRDGRR